MERFERKVAVVTGSTRRIGKGIAKRFAREGAHVVINGSSSPEALQKVVASYITGQVFYVDGGMLAQLNTPRWRRRDEQRGAGRER